MECNLLSILQCSNRSEDRGQSTRRTTATSTGCAMHKGLLLSKPRPTEIKLVAKLLDPDADNSEDATALAIEIIEALDKSRTKRESFIVVAKLSDWTPLQAWGELSTRLQAEKFFPNLSSPDTGGMGSIARLENPDDLLKRIGAQ